MHIAYISSSNQKVLTHTGSSMKSVLSCNRMRQYYNPNFLPYWFLRIQTLFYITHWCHHCMHDIFLPKFKVSKVWYKKKLILLNFGYTHVYLSLCVISVQNIFLQWRWPYTALSYINQNRFFEGIKNGKMQKKKRNRFHQHFFENANSGVTMFRSKGERRTVKFVNSAFQRVSHPFLKPGKRAHSSTVCAEMFEMRG